MDLVKRIYVPGLINNDKEERTNNNDKEEPTNNNHKE